MMINIRPIQPNDNAVIAEIIRIVSSEYQLSDDPGFSVHDPQLEHLYETYNRSGWGYWVIETDDGQILGGAGIGQVEGISSSICELQKMYFHADLRGQGVAHKMMAVLDEFARSQQYKQIYLETTERLGEAVLLYQQYGFKRLDEHLGNTGHHSCEIPMLKQL